MNTPHERLTTAIRIDIPPLQLGKEIVDPHSYTGGLRFKRQGIREIVEVRILTLGHSCSRTYASYPSCVTAYPLGSRSRMFTVRREKLSLPAPGSAARRAHYRKSDPPLATNRRFPGSHKPRLANPKLSLFRRVRGRSPQTPKN